MRAREFEAFIRKHLLPFLPGFAVKGALLYARPVEYYLRGFAFESSGYQRTSFNVWAFIQPLYVLRSYVAFCFGGRLGTLSGKPGHWWDFAEQGEEEIGREVLRYIQLEGLPFLGKLRTPVDLVKRIRELTSVPDNPVQKEAWCYALVLIGESARAARELERLRGVLETYIRQYPYRQGEKES